MVSFDSYHGPKMYICVQIDRIITTVRGTLMIGLEGGFKENNMFHVKAFKSRYVLYVI